jgi:hypothetical protein
MNRELEKIYETLNKTEPTRDQMLEYSWAIKELSEGLTSHSVWDMFRHVETAQRHLTEFKGHFIETPKLDENEGNLAGALHTYMRKGMDSPLSVMLYRMIAEDRGTPVWYAFVKGLAANKRSYREAIQAADAGWEVNKTTDNLLMLECLRIWGDQNFADAMAWTGYCKI